METTHYTDVHFNFKLNGFKMSKDDLCQIAYCFIKEGEAYERPIGDFILNWFDGNDYIEMQTSGTTGMPKAIRVQKQSMVNSALATGAFFDLDAGNTALLCLPVQYVAGKMMLVRAMVLGLELDIVEPKSTPLYDTNSIYDFVALVPLQVQHSISDLKRVKKLIVGGAKLNNVLEKQLKDLKTQSYETYGMTETITHIAAKKVGEHYFNVLPNVTVSADSRSCLVVKAPSITPDIIVTNDLVELVNDKQFKFLGRADNVINSGGIKLIPEQIEEQLEGKIAARFFITSKPDEVLGEKVVLVIEGVKEELDSTLFEGLGKYEVPKEVLFIPKFIETQSGKIKRNDTLLLVN
jgi:O-succinylbenzoic acid--CoA ligase